MLWSTSSGLKIVNYEIACWRLEGESRSRAFFVSYFDVWIFVGRGKCRIYHHEVVMVVLVHWFSSGELQPCCWSQVKLRSVRHSKNPVEDKTHYKHASIAISAVEARRRIRVLLELNGCVRGMRMDRTWFS